MVQILTFLGQKIVRAILSLIHFLFLITTAEIFTSNNENPTEYKPVGIDVLEKLVSTFGSISQAFSSSVASYNTQKPGVATKFTSNLTQHNGMEQ
jgi:hypothetical protein